MVFRHWLIISLSGKLLHEVSGVLQWPTESLRNYENLLATEDLLLASLPVGNEIDGHDAGSAQMNIFILADDPTIRFQHVKSLLEKRESWRDARVAYRRVSGNRYTILWPEQLTEFKVD